MAAPNIVNVTNIVGSTAVQSVSNTATAIVTNSVGSNSVIKVNALYISNSNTISNANVTIDLYRSSVAYNIGYLITVPSSSTLDVISKSVYLQEGDSLRLTAGSINTLQSVCSYEVIS